MDTKLFDDIINISDEGKLLDKNLILKIARIEISKLDVDTKKSFRYFLFVNNSSFCGLTNSAKGVILIDLNNCFLEAEVTSETTILEKNLYVTAIVLHEIEHLKENYKIKNKTFEGKLIHISDYIDNYENGKPNYDNYDNNSSEKIAFAKSWKKVLNTATNYPNFQLNYPDAYKFVKNQYIKKLKLGYSNRVEKRNSVPLLRFISATEDLTNLNLIGFKLVKSGDSKNIDKISIEKKFMYGFPVNNKDKKELNKQKILTIR